jgi:hypothetical protein
MYAFHPLLLPLLRSLSLISYCPLGLLFTLVYCSVCLVYSFIVSVSLLFAGPYCFYVPIVLPLPIVLVGLLPSTG